MTRRLLVSWAVSRYIYNVTDGIRVRIAVDAAEDMPSKIFAYQLLPLQPAAATRVGAFDHVCSPVDLEEYPEDTPLTGHRPEWFRLDYVDVLVRSRAEADALLADILQDIRSLKATLDTMDTLLPSGEIWIDDAPEDDPASVSDSSSSDSLFG